MVHYTHTCPQCRETKPLTEFAKDRHKKSGHKSACKECDRKRVSQYYEKTRREKLGHVRLDQLGRKTRPILSCAWCGKAFKQRRDGVKCCSRECSGNLRTGGNPKSRQPGTQIKIHKCTWCDNLFSPGHPSQVTCSAECGQNHRHARYINKAHRRRSQIAATTSKPIKVMNIYHRDKWICQICNDQIDQAAVFPDPASVSLDHIIPLSKGGTHTEDNVQAAHLGCNWRKGNSEPQPVGVSFI